ncbi:MAG: transporter substrate-binding domain-containing protein [Prevotella sp.]|nr:transporter substrate-binding domain-containing protein [Prevotella sp.]
MRKRIFAIFIMLCAVVLGAKADNLGYSKYHPLIVGLDLDYAPLQYVNSDGLPQGYDVEFTQELMERLNIPYTYSPNTWSNISGDVLSGRVDLAMMVYSPYRKDLINYSRAVFRLYYQIVFREDSELKFDVRNLSGKSIAYMASRPLTDTLTRVGAQLNVVRDLPKAIVELSKGKYDAVICFRYQAKYLISQYKLKNLETQDLTLTPREYCYVSHNKQLIDAINVQLELMERDGTITNIYGDVTSQFGGLTIPTWVWYVLAAIVLISLVIIVVIQYRHQKQLRREMERAQLSERMKTVFLGNVSHALHTPLNAIIGFSDLLQSSGEGDISFSERQELLGIINTNGKQLLYFINELLQLSDIEGNKLQLNRIEADIRLLMEEYRRETEPLLHKGVSIQIESPHALCITTLDTNLMRQVMTQFLTNAAKHTQQGSITIRYAKEKEGLHVSVTDTGEGVPESLRENIFGLLIDKNTFIQDETPGLGLTICKAIIDHVGGRIGVTSETGKGSRFWFWVPCEIKTE